MELFVKDDEAEQKIVSQYLLLLFLANRVDIIYNKIYIINCEDKK